MVEGKQVSFGLDRLEFTTKKRSPKVIVEEVDDEVIVRRGDTVVARGEDAAIRYLFSCPKCGKRATWVTKARNVYLYACHPETGGGKHMWLVAEVNPVLMRLASLLKDRVFHLTDDERQAIAKLAASIGGETGQLREILESMAKAEKVVIHMHV